MSERVEPMTGAPSFPETRWSVVMLAASDGEAESQHALAQLFRAYWYPLFAQLRARGHSAHEAEDLLQAFFLHVFEKHALGRASRFKGSFRGFLIGCLKYFLANQRELAAAYKRGGHIRLVSFDAQEGETRMLTDGRPDPAEDVEHTFDRQWARLVMERALGQLQSQYAGRPEVFTALKGYLTATDESSYAEVAARLQVSLPFVKTTVHRMRRQFRDILRREIAVTVSAPHEIDEELRHLIHVLAAD